MTDYALRNTLVIVWRVTEYCDLGCHFCAYSRHLRRPRRMADPDQVLAFGERLGAYAALYSRDVLVSWLGGEPLRWPPVFDLSRTFKRQFNLRVSATTNGTALTSPAVRQHIIEDFDQLTLSLDGLGAVHDQLRDAPGLYDQLRVNVASLRELRARLGRGPRLRVNTILMRDNIHAFEDLCRTLAEWGVEELTFNALGGRDRPEFYPAHSLLPEQIEPFRQALPGIRERLARLGLAIYGGEGYLQRIDSAARGVRIPVHDCQPGRQFLFIDERGFISPCSFTTRGYGVHLSEIRTSRDLHHLPARFTEHKQKEVLAACLDCPSTQVFGKFDLVKEPPRNGQMGLPMPTAVAATLQSAI